MIRTPSDRYFVGSDQGNLIGHDGAWSSVFWSHRRQPRALLPSPICFSVASSPVLEWLSGCLLPFGASLMTCIARYSEASAVAGLLLSIGGLYLLSSRGGGARASGLLLSLLGGALILSAAEMI